jgi:hypothetical protein
MSRWWALGALPAAQAAMLTVSARHDSGLEGDVPRYGFPWPFTWFSGFSSLHWDVAPLGWLIDLLVYATVLMPCFVVLGALVRRLGADAERAGRRVCLALTIVAALVVGAFQLVPALLGWRHLAWELPAAGATRGLAWAPFSPW